MPKTSTGAPRNYAWGLIAVAAGGGIADLSGSMLPLAMASAAALMTTAGLIKHLIQASKTKHS